MLLSKKKFYKNTDLRCSHINVGFGSDLSIKVLANIIKEITKYKGKIVFDVSKPDGMKKKLLNSKKILSFGWKPKFTLKDGLKRTYKDFLARKT